MPVGRQRKIRNSVLQERISSVVIPARDMLCRMPDPEMRFKEST